MNKFYFTLVAVLLLVSIGIYGVAEVNISDVEGKYREPTVQDAVTQHRIRAVQLMNIALHEAYLSGYGQAMIDYGIVVSTQPAKVITVDEEDER